MLTAISNNIFELLKLSIPSIFAIILFLLSSKRVSAETRKSKFQERINKLYVPFYQFCITHHLGCLLYTSRCV